MIDTLHISEDSSDGFLSYGVSEWSEAWRLLGEVYSRCELICWAVSWTAGEGPEFGVFWMHRDIWEASCESPGVFALYVQTFSLPKPWEVERVGDPVSVDQR